MYCSLPFLLFYLVGNAYMMTIVFFERVSVLCDGLSWMTHVASAVLVESCYFQNHWLDISRYVTSMYWWYPLRWMWDLLISYYVNVIPHLLLFSFYMARCCMMDWVGYVLFGSGVWELLGRIKWLWWFPGCPDNETFVDEWTAVHLLLRLYVLVFMTFALNLTGASL